MGSINISSENGTRPYLDVISYSVLKGVLNNFSRQYAADGILVTTMMEQATE